MRLSTFQYFLAEDCPVGSSRNEVIGGLLAGDERDSCAVIGDKVYIPTRNADSYEVLPLVTADVDKIIDLITTLKSVVSGPLSRAALDTTRSLMGELADLLRAANGADGQVVVACLVVPHAVVVCDTTTGSFDAYLRYKFSPEDAPAPDRPNRSISADLQEMEEQLAKQTLVKEVFKELLKY